MTTKIDWNDDGVRKAVRAAAAKAINQVMAECLKEAREGVPLVTGTLEGSIQAWQPAQPGDSGPILGVWGSADVNYALAIELGDRSLIPAGSQPPRPPARGTPRNTGNKGFLRAAADKYYPTLAERIAEGMP